MHILKDSFKNCQNLLKMRDLPNVVNLLRSKLVYMYLKMKLFHLLKYLLLFVPCLVCTVLHDLKTSVRIFRTIKPSIASPRLKPS